MKVTERLSPQRDAGLHWGLSLTPEGRPGLRGCERQSAASEPLAGAADTWLRSRSPPMAPLPPPVGWVSTP